MRSLLMMLIACVTLGAACSSTSEPSPKPAAIKVKVSPDGGLRFTMRKASVEGQVLHINGALVNRYDKPVAGVRYTIEMAIPGSPPRIINTAWRETETTLEPGQVETVVFEIDNPVYASTSAMFSVDATPVKLGGTAVPPPAGWKP
ncbi:hypothetical protein KF840_10465 [bacterium]|nr:hypothetical protein [bacterium]